MSQWAEVHLVPDCVKNESVRGKELWVVSVMQSPAQHYGSHSIIDTHTFDALEEARQWMSNSHPGLTLYVRGAGADLNRLDVEGVIAQRNLAIKLLQKLEWAGHDYSGFPVCPECYRDKGRTHEDDCALGALLSES
jgi:hypothetical protein